MMSGRLERLPDEDLRVLAVLASAVSFRRAVNAELDRRAQQDLKSTGLRSIYLTEKRSGEERLPTAELAAVGEGLEHPAILGSFETVGGGSPDWC